METLTSMLTNVICFLHDSGELVSKLAKPLGSVEGVAGLIALAVVVAGIAANGLWKPSRRRGEDLRD